MFPVILWVTYGICCVLSYWMVNKEEITLVMEGRSERGPNHRLLHWNTLKSQVLLCTLKPKIIYFVNFLSFNIKKLNHRTLKSTPSVDIRLLKKYIYVVITNVVISAPRSASRKVSVTTWQRCQGSISAAVWTIIYTSTMTLRNFAFT